ncbi:hypothetical protein BGW38_002274 [Lunasporangiospora selenospora]|uniref:Uncharacterized protein n=1 Tax=Lunasporangiospora selenospora TaxID=979761 RepID=A0A9P6FUE5_9FUNG|nr:hypothetical protein BGW38_002274 [Lunasporangiospora selenospora]
MSFGRGKDSGYMSFSTNSPSQQHSSAVTTAENSPTDTLRDDVATRPEVVIDVDFVKGKEIPLCGEKDQGISSKNPPPTPTPPAGPPRYHEVNMQMFNDPEDENSLAIVYSVLDSTDNDPASHASELRPIFACTVIKLIEKMTHQYGMDLGFRTDFFLTYRLFVSPVQLCKHLIRRYLWALEEDTSLREIVRVRTFVVIRHWIINHFEDDFLTSKSLRFIMASFLNDMRCNQRVLESPTDLLIIKNLVDLFKEMRRLYKGIAEQHLARFKEGEQNEEEQGGQTSQPASEVKTPSSNSDNKPVTGVNDEPRIIEQLTASSVKKIPIVLTGKTTNSDITGGVPHACGQIRSRNRASTLGGLITRPVAIEALHPTTPTKVSASKDSKHGGVSRQASENGTLIARERRLSASSIKSNKGNNVNWSTKMTLGIHKLRQKSEDIYQQILNPISALQKGEAKQCTCWTPEYTGISENPTLSAARSFPNLRPSVVVTNVNYESSPQPPAGNTTSGCPPSKTIKRLKSTLNLGPGSITTPVSPSPIPSPTRSQFTGMSSRHSRSNSNSSVGYHPNPECPYHVPSLGTVSSDSQRSLLNSNEYPEASSTLSTPKNIPQFNHPDSAVQTPSLSVTTGTPHSPAWYQCPWYTPSIPNSPSVLTTSYKPFILFYRSQVIAQQLCLLEQHFLDQVKWDEFLENELAKAGRRSWNKSQSSISGYLFKAEKKNGVEAISSRSDMVCMWVASEVVSTHPIEDRVRVIEKFIRIAQKCYQYRNFSSLSQLVMGLGSHFLCRLRRTWSRVGNYEMRVLRELQYVISPCKNWSALRTAMGVVGQQEATGDSSGQRYGAGVGLETPNGSGLFSPESMTSQNDTPSSKHPQSQTSVDKRGCIPFLGLFTFDLEHIMEQAAWYMPLTPSVLSEFENSQESSNGQCVIQRRAGSVTRPPPIAAHLTKPEPKDLPELIPTGKLLLNFYRCQLIAKTLKWFLAFQRRAHRYSFAMDATLYSKCLLLRVLNEDLLQELSDSCDSYRGD